MRACVRERVSPSVLRAFSLALPRCDATRCIEATHRERGFTRVIIEAIIAVSRLVCGRAITFRVPRHEQHSARPIPRECKPRGGFIWAERILRFYEERARFIRCRVCFSHAREKYRACREENLIVVSCEEDISLVVMLFDW